MEVWILLAAAGSGYLARRWQNCQKTKNTPSDGVEPQDSSGCSSSQLPSARGRYRHFSSANKRQGGRSLCGNHWGRLSVKKNGQVAENTTLQNVTERKAEDRVDFGGRETQISSEVRAVNHDGDILSETKLASSSVVDKLVAISENVTAGCLVQSVQGNEIIAFEPSRVQKESTAQPIEGCDRSTFVGDESEDGTGNVRNVIERVPRGQAADGRGLDGSNSFFSRSNSVKRLNDERNENDLKGGRFLEDGYAGKRMKDALESTVPQEEPFVFEGTWMPGFWDAEEPFVFGGTWMPGFLDVSEEVFVLDADSRLVQQESEARSRGGSTRKVKTPNKYGRSRGSMCRRKSLTAQKPMSSLESCLSAQLDQNYKQRNSVEFLSRSGSSSRDEGDQPVGDLGVSLDEGLLGHVVSEKMSTEGKSKVESAIGLPSLSRRPSRRRSPLMKLKEIKGSTGRESKRENLYNPYEGNKSVSHLKATQRNSAGWQNIGTRHEAKLHRPSGLNRESCTKGVAGTSSEGLLFNFGVGVGMMFTIMSNKREVKKLTNLLREAECLMKDLEAELQERDVLGLECGSSCNNAEEDNFVERRHSVLSCTLKKVRSATHLLKGTRASLTEESEPVSSVEPGQLEDISQLEAELEAELERMELNLNDGNISKHRRRYSSSSELDADISVQGGLSVQGLPCEVEVESDIEDSIDSPHEDLHVSNSVVSPRELAKRLHEVLETRLENQIAELEAELNLMGSKLQSQEDELQWWKGQSLCCTEGYDGGSFSKLFQKAGEIFETSIGTEESAERQVLSSLQVEEKQLSSPVSNGSLNAYPVVPGISGGFSSHDLKNDPSRGSHKFQKVPKTKKNSMFITLAGDALAAYNEACDDFSKVVSDSDIGAEVSVNGSTGTRVLPENDSVQEEDLFTVKDRDIDLVHSGSPDLWEQVDLLSLAEDFYTDGNSEFMVQMSEFSKAPPKGGKFTGRSSCKKGMMSSHPEPEQSLAGLKAVDSSDDATNDTSGSTPCSVKFIDVSTVGFCDMDDQLKSKVETGANSSKSPYSDWSEDAFVHAGANTPVVSSQEEKPSLYFDQSFEISSESPGHREVASTRGGDWVPTEDGDSTSDLDEQIGQLLIKRIVEKSRRGSPILQDVKTVIDSFERSETSFAADSSSARDLTALESTAME